MQRRFAVLIVVRKNLELRMQHLQLAGIAVELDLAEQSRLHAFAQHVRQIAAVKPFADQYRSRRIAETRFKHAEIAALESRKLR